MLVGMFRTHFVTLEIPIATFQSAIFEIPQVTVHYVQ